MFGWEVIPRIPLGPFSVSPHGVGIAVGYFIGAMVLARRARRVGFDEDHAWNAAVIGVIGAIVGARIAYVIGHPEQFQSPIEYLQIYRGGISLVGGLIGGFLAAFVYCRSKGIDFLRLADLGSVGLAIGVAVGRIGDLVIGDHLGKVTDGPWGWEYRGGELISAPPCDPDVYPSASGCIEPGMVVHQTALYDMFWSLVILGILVLLERKPRAKGFMIFTWAALYALGRIATDFTRVDKTWFGTDLTGSQLTSIVVVLIAAVFLVRNRKAPQTEASGMEPAEAAAGKAADAGKADAGRDDVGGHVAVAPAATVAGEPPKEAQGPAVTEAEGPVSEELEQEPAAAAQEETPAAGEAAAAAEETPAAGEAAEPAAEPAEETPAAGEAAEPAEETPAAGEAAEPAAEPAEETPAAGEAAEPAAAAQEEPAPANEGPVPEEPVERDSAPGLFPPEPEEEPPTDEPGAR